MDKSKLASLGERLRTQGAQMGRMMSTKMKDLLQTPTPESRMVDEATAESLPEPNWSLNLRICALINAEEFSGAEVVRAVKRKLSAGRSASAQRLALELLEACAANCEKVFSEVASEKVLEEMVRVIEGVPRGDPENRRRAWELIRVWGESEDLAYLPVFRQTYLSLKNRGMPSLLEDTSSLPMEYSLESYINQQPLSPDESYPIPHNGHHNEGQFQYDYSSLSVEDKKEFLSVTRNSLEVLSSILNSGIEQQNLKDDLLESLLDKCKQSLPTLQRIIERTSNDEGMLFEALNLHDELQQVISRCEGLEVSLQSNQQKCETSHSPKTDSPVLLGAPNMNRESESPKHPESRSSKMTVTETRMAELPKVESTESAKSVRVSEKPNVV